MAKDDIDLEEFDYDSFDVGDYGDDNFDDIGDDREPTNIVVDFGKSVGASLVSKESLLDMSKDALPSSYGKAVGLIESTVDSITSIYDESKDELDKSKGVFKSLAKSIDKSLGKNIPSIISNQLKRFYEEEDYSYQWGKTDHSEEIAQELKGIFESERPSEDERKEDLALESAKLKEQAKNTDYSRLAAESLNRLVSYQDNITIKYQQKSLELQYKQYYLQKSLLETSNEYFKLSIKLSKGIEKNTGLPDAVKINQGEMLSQTIKQRMMNSTLNKVSDFSSGYLDNFTKNLSNYASGIVSGVTTSAEFIKETREAMDSLPESERRAMMADMAGGELGSRIRGIVGNKLGDVYNSYAPESVKKGFAKLGGIVSDPYAYMNEFANSSTKQQGIIGDGINLFKTLLPTYTRDSSLSSNSFLDADTAIGYDKLSRKTITEIIPEYLSQIARWTKAQFTGTDDGELGRMTYDHVIGRMSTQSDSLKSINSVLFPESRNKYTTESIDEFISELTGDEQITEDARSLLRRQLLDDATNNKKFNIANYADPSYYTAKGSEDSIYELADLISIVHDIGIDGKVNKDKSAEYFEKLEKLNEDFVSLKQFKVDMPIEHIKAISDTYGKDMLYRLGYLDREGKRDMLNYDRIWDETLSSGDNTIDDEVYVKGQDTQNLSSVNLNNDHRSKNHVLDSISEKLGKFLEDSKALNESVGGGYIPQSNIDTTNLEELLGENGPLYKLIAKINLSKLEGHSEATEELLNNIFINMASIGLNNESGVSSTIWKWSKRSASKASNMTKEYFKFWGRQYRKGIKKIPSGIGNVFTTARDITTGTLSFITGSKGLNDIYVKGRIFPLLKAVDIRDGLYMDKKTGKVIRSLKDIKGEVVDRSGNIIISAEDFAKGLYDNSGKNILSRGLSMIGNTTLNAFGLYGKALKLGGSFIGNVLGITKTGRDKVDLYLKGKMETPILLWNKLVNGEYFDENGKVMKSWKDIKGKVFDADGNVVITLQEIRSKGGLVDITGKALSSILKGGISLLGGITKGYGKVVGGMTSMIGSTVGAAFRMAGRGAKRLFGKSTIFGSGNYTDEYQYEMTYFAQEQTVLQENILEQLKILVNGSKGDRFDKSGDGLRDGSAASIKRDRLADRKREKEDRKRDKETGGRKERGVVGNAIANAAGAAGSWAMGKAAAAGAAVWAGTKMAGSMLATAGMATAKFIGKQVLWRGLQFAGTAITGTIGLPGVLIGAAVAGIGYGGYKLWKRLTREDAKIHELRMAQYGFHYSDQKEVSKILELETMLEPHVRVDLDKGTGEIKAPAEIIEKFMKLFDVDITSDKPDKKRDEQVQRIITWYKERFQPVFVAHMAAKTKHAKQIPLHQLDSSITGRKALLYLKDVKLQELIDSGTFNSKESPFKNGWVFDAKLSENAKDVSKFYDAAVKFFTKMAKDEPEEKEPGTATVADGLGVGEKRYMDDDEWDDDDEEIEEEEEEEEIIEDDEDAAKVERKERSKMSAVAAITATSPALLAMRAGKSILDKLKTTSFFKTMSGAIGGLVGGLVTKATDTLESVKSTIVPNFIRDGWNDFWEDKPTNIERVRYHTYGLVDITGSKVDILRKLESFVHRDIQYSTEGVVYNGDPNKTYDKFAGRFKIKSGPDSQAAIAWKGWFVNRFLPTFKLYLTLVRQYKEIDLGEAEIKLSPNQLLEVANGVTAAQYQLDGEGPVSVWEWGLSPWPDTAIGMDSSVVNSIIAKYQDIVDGKGNAVIPLTGANVANNNNATQTAPGIMTSPQGTTYTGPNKMASQGGSVNLTQGGGGFIGAMMPGNTNAPTLPGGVPGGGGGQSGGMMFVPEAGVGGAMGDIPLPSGSGWEGSKDTIVAAAKAVGMDPSTMATIAALESNFNPSARPWSKKRQAYLSSAKGYYQFIDSTWKQQLKEHGAKYGIPAGTSAMDPRANALMGGEYIKAGYKKVKSILGGTREPTDVDVYMHHFLGPGGVAKFLKADGNADATAVMGSDVARANPGVFRFNDGKGPNRTISQVYQELDKRLDVRRKQHGLVSGSSMLAPASNETMTGQGVGAASYGDGGDASPMGGSPVSSAPQTTSTESTSVSSNTVDTPSAPSTPSAPAAVTSSVVTTPTTNTSTYTSSMVRQATSPTPTATNNTPSMSQSGNMTLILKRDPSASSGTYGELSLPNGTRYQTLELGWKNNQPRISCIPAGTYQAAVKQSGKFGTIYQLEDVPGRSGILIHAGNVAGDVSRGEKADSSGCILIGFNRITNRSIPTIGASSDALKDFMSTMGNRPFTLTILDGGVDATTMEKQTSNESATPTIGSAVMEVATQQQLPNSGYGGTPAPMTPQVTMGALPTPGFSEQQYNSAYQTQMQSAPMGDMFGSSLKETESLLRIGNELAGKQLSVLESIDSKLGGEMTGTMTVKQDGKYDSKVAKAASGSIGSGLRDAVGLFNEGKEILAPISGISFSRKRRR